MKLLSKIFNKNDKNERTEEDKFMADCIANWNNLSEKNKKLQDEVMQELLKGL